MAITECGRGHVYDSDQYATCPYCNHGASVIDFGASSYQQPPEPMGYQAGYGYAPVPYGAPAPYAPMEPYAPVSPYAPAEVYAAGDDYGPTVAPGVIGGVNPEDEGKTVSPYEMKRREEEENKTVVMFQRDHNYDPVVGWIVCIDGPDKGKDHRIMARINTIGRSEKMDICLSRDTTVTKENHARIAYDPKNNVYLIVPDKNINNIYVNGQPIFSATRLEAYDTVELGAGKYLFLPLCGDRFEWEIGLKTAEN